MAASLSRPDPSSPSSVAEAGFSTSRRGFNQGEVRAFLTSVGAELSRVQDRVQQLEAEVDELRSPAEVPELDEATVASLLGEETVRVLQTARESASEIRIRAEESAARIVREADEKAKRLRHEAEVEAARRRQDATSGAEAEIALAKQQGREMVNEARAYRERVLADLERRTTLARNQIEELLHGRDRLLQVFERARLVAIDVTSELQGVDGPDELVNLAATTGPLPVMVPNSPRPVDSDMLDAGDLIDNRDESAGPTPSVEPPAVDDMPPGTDDAATEVDVGDDAVDDDHEVIDVEPLATDDVIDDELIDATDDDDDDDDDAEAAEAAEAAEGAGDDGASTNVVSLFRGDDDEASDDLLDDEVAEVDWLESDADDDPSDIGGIFARLRRETETDADEADADDAQPETDADTGPDADTDAEIDADPGAPVVASGGETAFVRRDEAIVTLIVGTARKIKRVLADEQNGVLDTLSGKRPVAELSEMIGGIDDHVAAYTAAIADDLLEAAAVGAAEVGEVDAALREQLGAAALDGANRLIRTDLIGPLRERLDRAVAAGDGDNSAVAKTIRSVYREWKTQHIDDQLGDVLRVAHAAGIVAAAGDEPLVWTIDPAHPACPDCEDNSLAGPLSVGQAYPTGHTSAPAHPGCRCLTLPAAR